MLEQQLSLRNWSHKLERYKLFFEEISIISECNRKLDISIIIISWRLHPDTLQNLMILNKQRNDINVEIIFVNNGAYLDEFQILLPYINKYITLGENTGAYLARNIGAIFADAPILLFLEDDGIPDEQLLLAHYLTHQKYNVIAVQGPYLYKTDNPLNEYQHHYYYGEKVFPKCSDLEGNSSYCADAFFEVGGWDDDITFGGGGIELSIRLNQIYPQLYNQLYSPICVLLHDYVTSMEHLVSKREKQLISHTRLKNKYPEWNRYIEKWLDRSKNREMIQIRNDWKPESEIILQSLEAEITLRNLNKSSKYTQERLFLSNPDHMVEHLQTRQNDYQIVIFGAGELGQRVYKLFSSTINANLVFADNNQDLWGKEINDIKVLSPHDLTTTNNFVYIASQWREEIGIQLREKGFVVSSNYSYVLI
ncbi:glycosyltransferase [Paenibacillus endoradicis]|uniref:glycosyltransferase n=1 Tax=Paenibacillus endoradicis TaxID=2972487 RepID=UPI002158ED76|nr:glycosyltransferase [Paenibacillus endoradicis]MCR8660519.1 glycosyltransferase [Paenibacillus endoradicis]